MPRWYNHLGYHFYDRNGVKRHSGITMDAGRREAEHQQRWPGGRLVVATQLLTEKNAREWEAKQTLTVTPPRRR